MLGCRERFCDRLAVYLESQSSVESLRDIGMPQFPWPDAYNPMLEYLVHRSEEIAQSDGRPAAVIWLAAHAWFEGALAALASAARRDERCIGAAGDAAQSTPTPAALRLAPLVDV